jgi:paired amphipathic helix protein Sin3a
MDEQNRQRALQQQDELMQREREYNERQERERQQREQYGAAAAHQNNTGSIPIHQPVASRLPSTIHSPGGLLAKHGGAPPGPLGAPSGPSNAFGGPLHGDGNRTIQHNPQPAAPQLQQHQAFGPGLLGHHAAPSNAPHGVSGGPGAAFGNALQQEAASRLQQIPFGPQVTPAHQIPGAPALGQGGQQPILNVSANFGS